MAPMSPEHVDPATMESSIAIVAPWNHMYMSITSYPGNLRNVNSVRLVAVTTVTQPMVHSILISITNIPTYHPVSDSS